DGYFGELVAIDHYVLVKAPGGSDGFDAKTADGRRVQIKTNYAADQIGLRGMADLMLVIGVRDDGTWHELYFGPFEAVLKLARRSERDNKYMVPVSKLPKGVAILLPAQPVPAVTTVEG